MERTDGPGPGDELRHLFFGFFRCPAELLVGSPRTGLQSQVIGQDAKNVGGIVSPPGHAKVDFSHGPVPVGAQEPIEAGLGNGRQPLVPVPFQQRFRRLASHGGSGVVIFPDLRGELPQGQVHFSGDVVGQPADHGLQFSVGCLVAEYPAYERQQGKAERRQRQDLRDRGEELRTQDSLHVGYPLMGGGFPGDGYGFAEFRTVALYPFQGRLRTEQTPEQRLGDAVFCSNWSHVADEFQWRFDGHRKAGVIEQTPHQHGGPGFHDIEDPGHDLPPDPAPQYRGEIKEDALAGLVIGRGS
ncbi:hypothetical protein PJL18_02700 [Paenarthrobacter nicotinovorans]|nr:hypothetical protein [Paenarthrobacter nicotinovorans]